VLKIISTSGRASCVLAPATRQALRSSPRLAESLGNITCGKPGIM
jgi:hypothetical protein